jgi:hypothetical protein
MKKASQAAVIAIAVVVVAGIVFVVVTSTLQPRVTTRAGKPQLELLLKHQTQPLLS